MARVVHSVCGKGSMFIVSSVVVHDCDGTHPTGTNFKCNVHHRPGTRTLDCPLVQNDCICDTFVSNSERTTHANWCENVFFEAGIVVPPEHSRCKVYGVSQKLQDVLETVENELHVADRAFVHIGAKKNIGLSYKSLYRYIKNLLGSGECITKDVRHSKRKRPCWQTDSSAAFFHEQDIAKISFASPRGCRKSQIQQVKTQLRKLIN
jgi:hypothetical protein